MSVSEALFLESHSHTTDGLGHLHSKRTELLRLEFVIQNVGTCCNTLHEEEMEGERERGGGRNQAREHLGICMKRRVLWGEKLRVKWKRRGRVYTGSSHKNYLFTIPRGHSGTHLPHWRSEYSGYKHNVC